MSDTKLEKGWGKTKDVSMHCPRCKEHYHAVILFDEDDEFLSIMYRFGKVIENGGQA